MKRRTILSLSLSLFLSLTLLLCACSSPKPTTTTKQPNVMDRITAAEARLTSLETTSTSNASKIATLEKDNKDTISQASINTAIDNANDAKSTATDALNKSKSLESSINDNQSKLLEANNTIESLRSTISTLQNEIKELQTSVSKVQQAIATPTPTPTSTSTPTLNKVEALLNGNAFTGQILLSYPAILIDGITQSLNFTIKNNTTSTISNISLALAFIFIDPTTNSPVNVPNIDASLSTIGLSPVWAKQTGSDMTMLIFTTQSGSGIFGSIYDFSQAPGNQSYTVNLTLTSKTGDIINKHYNVYPILRLISYQ